MDSLEFHTDGKLGHLSFFLSVIYVIYVLQFTKRIFLATAIDVNPEFYFWKEFQGNLWKSHTYDIW